MKTCVVTANYACDPSKVWLYLTKPTLNGWRKDVRDYEESDDGMRVVEHHTDGTTTELHFTRKEKPRCLSCNFQNGKGVSAGWRLLHQSGMHHGNKWTGVVCQAEKAFG